MLIPESKIEAKELTFDDKAYKKLYAGVKKVADAVGATMGPRGRTVISEAPGNMYPKVTKDGVSVAKQMIFRDQGENLGARLVIQACDRQVITTGDGTTLTAVLSHSIFKEGLKFIKQGHSPTVVVESIKNEKFRIIDAIKKRAWVSEPNDIRAVADIATNADYGLSGMISHAVLEAGENGIVTAIKNNKPKHEAEECFGYHWDTGIKFQEFFNDPKGLRLHNCRVLVTDMVLEWTRDIWPLLEDLKNTTGETNVVIISPNVQGECLRSIVESIRQGLGMFMPWIPTPGVGTERKLFCEDIAAITGATFIKNDGGIRLKDVKEMHLGRISYIKSDIKRTIIEGRDNDSPLMKERVETLKELINQSDEEPYDQELYKKSLAKITGKMWVLKIGGQNESEIKETIDRAEDAILACQSAREMGCVEGGGITLLRVAQSLSGIRSLHRYIYSGSTLQYFIGSSVFKNALKAPFNTILQNAGLRPFFHSRKLLRSETYGFDVRKAQHERKTCKQLKIIDPAKVVINAVENATSVACLLLNTKVMITHVED